MVVKRTLEDDGDLNVNAVKKQFEEHKKSADARMEAERQYWAAQFEAHLAEVKQNQRRICDMELQVSICEEALEKTASFQKKTLMLESLLH